MRSHIAPSSLVWKLSTSAASSRPSACRRESISASVMVPYCLGSRLPNMLWLMPWSMSTFMMRSSSSIRGNGDHLAAARGFGDRFGNTQILQAVARRNQRLHFAAHDRAEMFHLVLDRIGAHQTHHTDF